MSTRTPCVCLPPKQHSFQCENVSVYIPVHSVCVFPACTSWAQGGVDYSSMATDRVMVNTAFSRVQSSNVLCTSHKMVVTCVLELSDKAAGV